MMGFFDPLPPLEKSAMNVKNEKDETNHSYNQNQNEKLSGANALLHEALMNLSKSMGKTGTDKLTESVKIDQEIKTNAEKEEGEDEEEGAIVEKPVKSVKSKNDKKQRLDRVKEARVEKPSVKPKNERKQHNKEREGEKKDAPKPFVPRLVCRYFMEGLCTKGDKCTFSHAVVPNKTPEEAKVKEPCKFHMAGKCMKGEACYYSHDLSGIPCKFFHLWRNCDSKSSCRFSHAPISPDVRQKMLDEAEKERVEKAKAMETIPPPSPVDPRSSAPVSRDPRLNRSGSSSTIVAEEQTKEEEEAVNDDVNNLLTFNPFASFDF